MRIARHRGVAAAWAIAWAFALAAAPDGVAQRILIVHEDGRGAIERERSRQAAGTRLLDRSPMPGAEVVTPVRGSVREAIDRLRRSAGIRSAERDVRVRAAAVPDLRAAQYGLDLIAGPAAWMLSRGAGSTVAVVDTGIALDHQDLRGRIAVNAGERVNGLDDDGNGLVDDVRGWNFVDRVPDASDDNGHGSMVAGVVAAEDDGLGVVGAAPEARLLPLKALDTDGAGYLADIAAAFDHAGASGIPVVNGSLGGPATQSPALDLVFSRYPDTLYVVASGNEHTDVDDIPSWPCSSPAPNVLCVGASDAADRPASFSNVGRRGVDLFAPGVDIVSTAGPAGYETASGTSLSTPYVSAIAALLAARDPGAPAVARKNAILAAADPVPGLAALAVTGGRANALRALMTEPADSDADGVGDVWDLCTAVPDAAQADADADGIGDACDDADADGFPDAADDCPAVAAPGTADGCPSPPAGRQGSTSPDAGSCAAAEAACENATVLSTAARVRDRRRRIAVRIELSRSAGVYVDVARRHGCHRGGCRFTTVAAGRATPAGTVARLRLSHDLYRRFPRGRYRISVTVDAVTGASATAVQRIRVR